MSDEKKIKFNPETKVTTVTRNIENDFKPEDIKNIYETALKSKEGYEQSIKHAEKIKEAIKKVNTSKRMTESERFEVYSLLFDIKSKFSIEQAENVIKYYEPLIETEKKTISELKDIYDKLQNEKTEKYIG